MQTYDFELVKPRQPKLPPIKQSRFGHMPLLPSQLPLINLDNDARLANESAWRLKREFGWPAIKHKDGEIDVYLDKKPFSFNEFVDTEVLPLINDIAPVRLTTGEEAQRFLGRFGLTLMAIEAPPIINVAGPDDSLFRDDPCFQHLLAAIEAYRTDMWYYNGFGSTSIHSPV